MADLNDLSNSILDALMTSWADDKTKSLKDSRGQSIAAIRGVLEQARITVEDVDSLCLQHQVAAMAEDVDCIACFEQERHDATIDAYAVEAERAEVRSADLERRLEMAREALEAAKIRIESLGEYTHLYCGCGYCRVVAALAQLGAPVERKPHSIMTRDEYDKFVVQGWHEVCHNYESGNTAVRYLGIADEPAADVKEKR